MRVLVWGLVAVLATLFAVVRYCIVFPRQPYRGAPPAATSESVEAAARLRRHVTAVASVPHSVRYPDALEAAARYIEGELRTLRLIPRAYTYRVAGMQVRNIEVVIEPEELPADAPSIVIGAHYDSPDDTPGANDNGTGVAALLELARALAGSKPHHVRLRLVFFVNEEQPYGKTELMGSYQYAKALKSEGVAVAGMISLETLGYFSNAPGSQRFPPPFGLIYPDTGNFVAFVALPGSRAFLHRAVGAFRRHAEFPSIGGLAPGFIEGIDLSDHWSFHQFGIPALMVTDTAPFRNPHYHQLSDTPATVDYGSLARITRGLEGMARELVGA